MATRLIVVAAAALALIAWHSLSWQMAVDAPLLAYLALAIDRWGAVPYRDLFDFNTPGAYLAYIALGRVFGYSEPGFRVADLTCLAIIAGTMIVVLRRLGAGVGAAAAFLFGVTYLGLGPSMSLQREYLLLLPIVIAIAAALSDLPASLKAAIIGILIGGGATIKPQSGVLLPVFLAWVIWNTPVGLERLRVLVVGALAFALPVVAVVAWLWSTGGLPSFIDIARHYWPLYNELTGVRPSRIVVDGDRWWWNAQRYFLSRDLRHLMVIPAIAGAWYALARASLDRARRREVALLVAIFVTLQLYPLAAGKFWGYHWLPAHFASAMLASLCFCPPDHRSPLGGNFALMMTVVMMAAVTPAMVDLGRNARVMSGTTPATAARIARELRPRLQPGDTVQPLDWTAGAVHALLMTEARIATPFLYDFYFYHHVSTRYVQSLRRRLIDDLDRARPALVVDTDNQRLFDGPDTTTQFAALADWLRRHYRAVAANSDFVIYERNDRAAVSGSDPPGAPARR